DSHAAGRTRAAGSAAVRRPGLTRCAPGRGSPVDPHDVALPRPQPDEVTADAPLERRAGEELLAGERGRQAEARRHHAETVAHGGRIEVRHDENGIALPAFCE